MKSSVRIEYIKERGYEDLLNQLTVYKDGVNQSESTQAYIVALYNTIKIVNKEDTPDDEVERITGYEISEVPSFENILGILGEYNINSKYVLEETFVLATFNDIKRFVDNNEKAIKEGTLQEASNIELRMVGLNPLYEKMTAWVEGGEEGVYKACLYGWFRGHYTDNHTPYYKKNVGLDYKASNLTKNQREADGNVFDSSFIDSLCVGLNICGYDFYITKGYCIRPYTLVYSSLVLGNTIKDLIDDIESINKMHGYGFDNILNLNKDILSFQTSEYIESLKKELAIEATNLRYILRWERPTTKEELKACLLSNSKDASYRFPLNIVEVFNRLMSKDSRVEDWIKDFNKSVSDNRILAKVKAESNYSIPSDLDDFFGVIETEEGKEFTVYFTPLKYYDISEVVTDILNDYDIDEFKLEEYICNQLLSMESRLYNNTFEALLIQYCMDNIEDFYLKSVFIDGDYISKAFNGKYAKNLKDTVDACL